MQWPLLPLHPAFLIQEMGAVKVWIGQECRRVPETAITKPRGHEHTEALRTRAVG